MITVTTAWLYPSRVEQSSSIGDTSWSNPTYIFSEDTSLYANSFFLAGGDQFALSHANLVINDVIKSTNMASTPDLYPFANIGGSTNLWGETSINGSQISGSKFGVAIGTAKYSGSVYTDKSYYLIATGYNINLPVDAIITGIEVDIVELVYAGGGGTIGLGIDTIKLRVTYTWDPNVTASASSIGGIFVNPPNREKPSKKYRYKVFSPDGNYLGDWRDISTDPEIKQDINSLISSLPLTFARNDTSTEPIVDILYNEDNTTTINNEDDTNLLIDTSPVAGLGSGTTLDTNYEVEVNSIYGMFDPLLNEDGTPILNEDASMILVEDGYPLGRPIFRGYIPRWELPLDGSKITSEVRSFAQDLSNIILETEDIPYIDNSTKSSTSYGIAGAGPTDYIRLAQSITIGVTKTISKVRLYAYAGWFSDVDCTVSLYSGTPGSLGTTLLASGVGVVNRNTPVPYLDIVFSSPVELTAGSYTMIFDTSSVKTGGNPTYPLNLALSSTSYSGGTGYYTISGTWVDIGSDFAFVLYEAGGATTVPFLSKDPSQILRSVVDFARSRGARINYTSDSIAVTGTLVSYTFNTNTIKEAIEKILELCPSGWYYYYDYGTDTIYLKEQSTTVDRFVRQGAMVVDGKITKTIEQVINDVLFSGGGNPALFIRDTRSFTTSVRRGLKKLSDNRVTNSATAIILADSEIDRYKDPLYAGEVTILEDDTYYLEDVVVGEMIGFIGFGSLIDGIVVQSVSRTYKPDTVGLALTYSVPTVNKRVEDIKRNLNVLENVNNPSTPA